MRNTFTNKTGFEISEDQLNVIDEKLPEAGMDFGFISFYDEPDEIDGDFVYTLKYTVNGFCFKSSALVSSSIIINDGNVWSVVGAIILSADRSRWM